MENVRIAVVTGTSTGFGALIAQTLTIAGHRVFSTMRDVAGRNAENARALEALGVTVVEMDVVDQASVDRAAARIYAATDRVDVLVNNAGVAYMGVAEAFSPDSFERQFATNVIGPHRVDRAFLPGMRERRSGLVVFVSSLAGRFAMPYAGIYAASKWALEGLAETLSYELRPFGVDVAILEPSGYKTNGFNAMVAPDDRPRLATYGSSATMLDDIFASSPHAFGDPQEIADAVLALVEMPPGSRPLRTASPVESPATRLNAATEPMQREFLTAFGFGALVAPEPVTT